MGGNSKPKKSSSGGGGSFSVLSFFKPETNNYNNYKRRTRRYWDDGPVDDYTSPRKVWPSEEDNTNKARWVADPRIDSKASAFIANFHATRISDPNLNSISTPKVFQQPMQRAGN